MLRLINVVLEMDSLLTVKVIKNLLVNLLEVVRAIDNKLQYRNDQQIPQVRRQPRNRLDFLFRVVAMYFCLLLLCHWRRCSNGFLSSPPSALETIFCNVFLSFSLLMIQPILDRRSLIFKKINNKFRDGEKSIKI